MVLILWNIFGFGDFVPGDTLLLYPLVLDAFLDSSSFNAFIVWNLEILDCEALLCNSLRFSKPIFDFRMTGEPISLLIWEMFETPPCEATSYLSKEHFLSVRPSWKCVLAPKCASLLYFLFRFSDTSSPTRVEFFFLSFYEGFLTSDFKDNLY